MNYHSISFTRTGINSIGLSGYNSIRNREKKPIESLRNEIEPLILYVGEGTAPRRNRFSRIIVRVEYFVLAWIASIMIAVLTIFYLSVKAALQNPVESLRYE